MKKKKQHPAGDPVSNNAITCAIVSAALTGAQVDYQETGNPLHLLNGFVTAARGGVPIPSWIIDKFASAIDTVLISKGKILLDEALGLAPKNGKRSRWTEQDQHEYDARIKWLFDQQLKAGLPLMSDQAGVPSAVEKVAGILGQDSDKHDSLRQTYHKRLKKHSSRLSR